MPKSLSKVAGNPFVPTASAMPVVFTALYKSPVPSSAIVPIPPAVLAVPLVLVAINLKVSTPSPTEAPVSLVIATRTNRPVLETLTKEPAV